MQNSEIERVLRQIAKENHMTYEEVRKEIQVSIDIAQASKDPVVQARWASIPRKGEKVTTEEFIEHMAKFLDYCDRTLNLPKT